MTTKNSIHEELHTGLSDLCCLQPLKGVLLVAGIKRQLAFNCWLITKFEIAQIFVGPFGPFDTQRQVS